jgi:hypothetical protein
MCLTVSSTIWKSIQVTAKHLASCAVRLSCVGMMEEGSQPILIICCELNDHNSNIMA